ncbi:PAS domain S-box protein [Magnetospirillum aberrantis]|uniref:Sensor protein FixL n=1 Tax=Magnetospirillum aberrantis SpK TaxID=908842 RepID=A0A7C9UUS6_9PROT|nr:PAS domain S-box protein [Magnetospirillum aberrantis]NFV80526.1 PAS domain S-box protein [Magnetospirillum aberrantis SpK]
MEFALQAALLGAVLGSALLAVTTLYGWSLPAAPNAYGWWAAAFTLEAASKAVLLSGGDSIPIEISDLLHGLAAGLSLCGALSFAGWRITPTLMAVGLVSALGWDWLAHTVRPFLHLDNLPLFGIGGIPLLIAAWAFLWRGGLTAGSGALRLAAIAFAAAGLHQLSAPLLHSHTGLATWSFVASQFLSMVMAVALLVVVLRRQQALVESEGQRANLLHSRLVDALGSVQDAVALFDGNDRLVTCNSLYRAFLAPAAEVIKPGRSFEDILRIEAERGVVPEAQGREQDWLFDMLADHVGPDAPKGAGREFQLWDGRWVAVSVYRTADGGHLRILRDVTSRRQAEASLQEGLNWLRGIMDTVVDGIVTIDDSGSVLSYNPAAERIFGYDATEVVGRNVSMLMPEPFRSAHDGYLKHYAETGEAHVVGIGRQVRGLRKNGETFPLDLAVAEMRQGDMITFIGVVRDITDRKRVEDALVESEQRFRDLAESASDWFWEMDSEFQFTFVSGRVRQILGVGPSFFIGRQFMELAEAGDAIEEWQQQLAMMRAHRPFRGFVFSHRLPSGAVKFVEMAGRPAFDADGLFCGYRGTATDITPLKRHEQELATQSAQRQAIIDNMGHGVVVFDREERLVAMNQPARALLDMPVLSEKKETLETLLLHLALLGEFGRGNAMTKTARRVERLRRNPYQIFEHARPTGMVLEVRSTSMPGGGLILTFADITDRKRVEDTLREAKEAAERGNRAKATFLANISHELRTPLNAIIGFSELMKHEIFGPLEPVSYRTYVDDIHESGMHLLELINDILDMSKAEAGMTDLMDSVVDVAALVRSSLRMMSRRATANGVELIEELPQSLPHLRADERRLRQIVLNLVSNAVKFTDDGGTVTVLARMDEAGFHLCVADTGIGMSPEDMERVMLPFVQADTRLSRKYEGTGLGLPLTKALVEAHGGTLTLSSVPNQGTTVEVTFPPGRIIADATQAIAADETLRRG